MAGLVETAVGSISGVALEFNRPNKQTDITKPEVFHAEVEAKKALGAVTMIIVC
jgi:hypothetical protein